MNRNRLPSGWCWSSLMQVAAKIRNAIVDGPFGSNLKVSDYVVSGVPVLQGKNLTDDIFRWFDIRYITEQKAAELRRSSVREGDILLVKIGSIGFSAELTDLKGHDFAIIPANLAKVTLNHDVVDSRYLLHWLKTTNSKRYFQRVASKTAQPALSLTKIKELAIPLPPLPEQRRIAAILDQADALRSKRRQAIAKLDSLTQSIFLDMFGDPCIQRVMLTEACIRITDGTHQPPKWESEGIPFLFVSNIVDGEIIFDTKKFISSETYTELTRRCPIEFGDVLYTTVGSYGNAALVSTLRKFAFQRHIAHLKPNATIVDSVYLSVMLHSPEVRRQVDGVARGVAQKTVNLRELKEILVPLPPLPLQQEFAERVRAIERLKQTQRAALAKLDELFGSLQQRAFKGEL